VLGYAASKYNEELLTLASKYIGHTFKCLSLTLEMPFKDNANLPDAHVGWNGARSAAWARRCCSRSCCRWTTERRGAWASRSSASSCWPATAGAGSASRP
jgi:hypothetical protein